MKILEINDRGIKLIEDGEVINQGLFNEKEDIPFEVKELLSIYDNVDIIVLKILISLDEDIQSEIKNVVEEIGWKLKKVNKISKKVKYILILLTSLELVLCGVIFFKSSVFRDEIFELKKENMNYRKVITEFDQKMNLEIDDNDMNIIFFEKSNLSEYLIFLSEVSRKSDVKYQKIQYIDKKIKIEGFGKDMKNISKLKKFISGFKDIDNSKFDFVRKEGEILYFLIELQRK